MFNEFETVALVHMQEVLFYFSIDREFLLLIISKTNKALTRNSSR